MACRHSPDDWFGLCPICFPDADYSIAQSVYQGEPVIEVLRNQEVWSSDWDKNFRFGRVKTAMILYSIATIEEFAVAENPGYMIRGSKVRVHDPDMIIRLQTFPVFINSYGESVHEPFLRLERIDGNQVLHHIGFGQRKAAALVILKIDIEEWLSSVNG
ncbi:MAG: hypothetical protein AB1531_01140 [Chloroflexota bacterium]